MRRDQAPGECRDRKRDREALWTWFGGAGSGDLRRMGPLDSPGDQKGNCSQSDRPAQGNACDSAWRQAIALRDAVSV